jgi:hypothetical protein
MDQDKWDVFLDSTSANLPPLLSKKATENVREMAVLRLEHRRHGIDVFVCAFLYALFYCVAVI